MKEEELKRFKEAKVKNREELMSLPNVNGVGVGQKIAGGRLSDKTALRVYVTEKVPVELLKKEERIPAEIGGVIVDVVPIGEVHLLTHMTHERPARGGDSISDCRPTYYSAGTLGYPFIDNVDGKKVILSNTHVMAGFDDETINYASVGDLIVQPGTLDWGNCTNDVIATLKRWHQYKLTPSWNKIDAAIAEVVNPADVIYDIYVIGPAIGTRALTNADVGTTVVQKNGRTTQYTQGTVVDIAYDTSTMTTFHGHSIRFEDQILVAPIGGVPVCDHGDSGSVVLDMDNEIVGLLFAGSSNGYMIANHIGDVLSEMNIRLPSPFIPVCMKEYVLVCKYLHINCLKMWIPGEDYCPVITPVPFFKIWEYIQSGLIYPDLDKMPASVRRQFEMMADAINKQRGR
jgi:hypothetical protein